MFPSAARLLLSLAALVASPDLPGEGPGPRLEDVRAIQYEYSPDGGLVVLEWSVAGGEFEALAIELDGVALQQVPGRERGVKLEGLTLGRHRLAVRGLSAGGEVEAWVEHEVLESSPVEPPTIWGCLFFGFDFLSGRGLLQVAWDFPPRDQDPYLEFEVEVDGERFHRLQAPDSAVTFRAIPEGIRRVAVVGVTRSYASPPATARCRAVGIPSPHGLRLTRLCQDGEGAARVSYQVQRDTFFTSVAAWALGVEGRKFLGYHPPSPQEVFLEGLPEGPVQVELSLARFEQGADEPYAISNLPDGPGTHARVETFINCRGTIFFRRGDSSGDGPVNITDAVAILDFLFLGGKDLPCPAAADVDDSGVLDVTDPVRLLNHLFGGGLPPAPPGSLHCGFDPTPQPAEECLYESCGPR